MKKKNELRLFQRIKNGHQEFFVTKILEKEIAITEMQINNDKLHLGKTLIINKKEIS